MIEQNLFLNILNLLVRFHDEEYNINISYIIFIL